MGYRAIRTIYRLKFEDREGLEVRMHSMSMEELLSVGDQAETLKQSGALSGVRELLDMFVSKIKDWNLESEEGEPTPRTMEGLLAHEPSLVLEIVLNWVEAVTQVSGPLGQRLTSGEPSPEASIPMDVSSPSLLS